MNTCKPQKISQLDNTNCLLPNDIIPVVQKGANRTISAKNLIDQIINRIKDILPGSSEAMCIAVEAKKLAEQASADATQALKNLANALAYATKAYQLACQMDARIQALEGDHALIIELQDALALLTRQVNINTQRINDIINSNILKITTDADNNYTIYTFYVDNRKIGEIKVPKSKEYTGSQYIDINEERVISLTGLANVAFTGDYTDLSNRPTKLTDFYIDIDFLKDSDLEDIEDRITDLEECCEELHTKYFKLINQLEENTQNIVYTIKVDNTRYIVPYDSTWDDIKIPSGSHNIEIAVNEESFIEDYPTLSYNYVTETTMIKKNEIGTLWGSSLKNINSNVILKGKIWSSQANGTLKVYDIDTNTLLFSSKTVRAAKSYTTNINAPQGYVFLASVEINNQIPSSLNAKVTYNSDSQIELNITNPVKDNIIYIKGLQLETTPVTDQQYPIYYSTIGRCQGTLNGPSYYKESDTSLNIQAIPTVGVLETVDVLIESQGSYTEVPPQCVQVSHNNITVDVALLQTLQSLSALKIVVKFDFDDFDPTITTYYSIRLSDYLSNYATITTPNPKSNPSSIREHTDFTLTVVPNTGYTINLTGVTEEETSSDSLLQRESIVIIEGNVVTVKNISNNIIIEGEAIPESLPDARNATVTNKISNSKCNLSTTPIGQEAVITITPDDGYQIKVNSITITNNGVKETITPHANDYGVDITIPTVNGDIVINGESIQLKYTASLGTNLKKITGASISPTGGIIGENREFTITLPNTHKLNAITLVKEANKKLIINNTTKVVINGNKVTVKNIAGDIVIDGTAEKLSQPKLYLQVQDNQNVYGEPLDKNADANIRRGRSVSAGGSGSIVTKFVHRSTSNTVGDWQLVDIVSLAYDFDNDTIQIGNDGRPVGGRTDIIAPTIQGISTPLNGNGVQTINFQVPKNDTEAWLQHWFIFTQGTATKYVVIVQYISSEKGVQLSRRFHASPYSKDKTVKLKFNDNWRIVMPEDGVYKESSALTYNDYYNDGSRIITYSVNRTSGSANDLLIINSDVDFDKNWTPLSSTTYTQPIFYVNTGESAQSYDEAEEIYIKHDSIAAQIYVVTPPEGSNKTPTPPCWIKKVEVGGNVVFEGNTTTTYSVPIGVYNKSDDIVVTLEGHDGSYGTVDIGDISFAVYYGAHKHSDDTVPESMDEYGNGVTWTSEPIPYTISNYTSKLGYASEKITFNANAGLITPDQRVLNSGELPWAFEIIATK